jgi:hypothetical protein
MNWITGSRMDYGWNSENHATRPQHSSLTTVNAICDSAWTRRYQSQLRYCFPVVGTYGKIPSMNHPMARLVPQS